MKKWEDIIKDKLEGYEVNPPQGSLADFRNRLNATRQPANNARKRVSIHAVVWAAAACVALLLMVSVLKPIMTQGDNLQITKVESIAESLPNVPEKELVADVVTTPQIKTTRQLAYHRQIKKSNATSIESLIATEVPDEATIVGGDEETEVISQTEIPEELPQPVALAEKVKEKKEFRLDKKKGLIGGGVLGAAVAGGVLSSVGGNLLTSVDLSDNPLNSEGSNFTEQQPKPEKPKDVLVGKPQHALPVKTQLGVRWKVADRWSLTSGLEYSLYSSTYQYSLSGEKKQHVHYLGVPVRMDFSVLQTQWVDAYLGVGGIADWCLAANIDGRSVAKDGFSFSLQGAGGVQLNLNKHLGAFVEPQVVWAIPSKHRQLETYRTANPVSFNLSVGLRFTIGK